MDIRFLAYWFKKFHFILFLLHALGHHFVFRNNLVCTLWDGACSLFLKVHVNLIYYYKMWVQFTSPCSLGQWIHCFPSRSHSLWPMNSFNIQWNHLAYRDTFCCSLCKFWVIKLICIIMDYMLHKFCVNVRTKMS
jgi:hypothetical protein